MRTNEDYEDYCGDDLGVNDEGWGPQYNLVLRYGYAL